jgi:hypothetical protein
LKKIKIKIDQFEANLGGTEILEPLQKSIELDVKNR